MTREAIFEEMNKIFREAFDDDAIVLHDSTTAADIEDWDSLMQITLLVAIEKKFLIKFSIQDVASLKNVGEIVDLIHSKVASHRTTL